MVYEVTMLQIRNVIHTESLIFFFLFLAVDDTCVP